MLEPLPWTRDKRGYLYNPDIHDALLVEFDFAEKGLFLRLRPEDSTYDFVFELIGVSNVNATIWSIPIVDHIIIADEEITSMYNDTKIAVMNALFRDQVPEIKQANEMDLIFQRKPRSLAFYMACSYGGPVACLAEEIRVARLQSP